MKNHLTCLNLPQNLETLSCIDTGKIVVSQWVGAVNFLFVQNNLLLIKRSETMHSHKGQLAFVGGHKLETETDPVETALRELEEETGITSPLVEIFGLSWPEKTSSNSVIIPVVSYVDMKPESLLEMIKSNGEWTEAILYPVEHLKRIDLWSQALGFMGGLTHPYPIYFHPILPPHYLSKFNTQHESFLLWGATAKMVWKFFKNDY